MIHLESEMQSSIQQPFPASQKMLKVNGKPAIVFHAQPRNFCNTVFIEENTLIFILNGMLQFSHGKSEFWVEKGQMAFIRNNTLVEYKAAEQQYGSNVEFISFELGLDIVKEFTRLSQLSPSMHPDSSEIWIDFMDNNLQKYLDSLMTYFDDPFKISDSLIRIKLLELLFTLSGSNIRTLDLLLDLRKPFRPDIIAMMENNIMNSYSISQLAVMAGRSLSSFRRDFLSIYNMPPSQWIREKRLKKAKEFLQNTNMTITDICYALGFENISHFSRLFKAHFGYAPSVFRAQSVSV